MTHQISHFRTSKRGKKFRAGRRIPAISGLKIWLDGIDKEILRTMVKEERFITTAEIADLSGRISWNTAQERLKRMYERGLINHIKRGSRDYWRAQGRI